MVDMYILCLLWIFCVLFAEDTEGSNSQPKNDDSVTAETFLTVYDLFSFNDEQITETELIKRGDALNLSPLSVRLMIQHGVDTRIICRMPIDPTVEKAYVLQQKLPY